MMNRLYSHVIAPSGLPVSNRWIKWGFPLDVPLPVVWANQHVGYVTSSNEVNKWEVTPTDADRMVILDIRSMQVRGKV